MGVEFRSASMEEAEAIHGLVQRTIMAVYPHYYAPPVVDFFCRWHNPKVIARDIEAGLVRVLVADGEIVGTGSHEEDRRIARVYVPPELSGRGFGTTIMDHLETEIFEGCTYCELDASVPATLFYEHRGYRTLEHRREDIGGGEELIYEVMRKDRR